MWGASLLGIVDTLDGAAIILAGSKLSLPGVGATALGTEAFLAAALVGVEGAVSSFSAPLELEGSICFPSLVSSSSISTVVFSSMKVLALSGSVGFLAGRLVFAVGTRLFPPATHNLTMGSLGSPVVCLLSSPSLDIC